MGACRLYSPATERGNWVSWRGIGVFAAVFRRYCWHLRQLAAQEMPARHEQIGQRAGHEQAMSVLLQPAIAHLGKAEHSLDDPDRMFNPGPHFGFGAVFRALDLIDNTAVAVAAIDEILGLWGVLPDHRPLTAVSVITPHTGLLPVQQLGQYRAVGDI